MPKKIIQYTKEQQRFIDEVICPALIGSTDKDIVSVTYDLNGKILHVTNAFARMFGYYDGEQVSGSGISKVKVLADSNLTNKLNNVRLKVIKTEQPAYYIVFAHYSYGFDAHAVYHYPLFMEDGSIIASRSISKRFTLFNPVSMFNNFFIKQSRKRKKKLNPDIELNPFEYRILFLLYVGLTQYEMAYFVEVSRGRLAQIFTELYGTVNKVSEVS